MNRTQKAVISALFLAIGIVLPFFTGQIPQIGKMLLPMHIPVFLCAFICGFEYATAIGLIMPILRSALFTFPIMYPNAVGMAIELCTYGLIAGLIYKLINRKTVWAVYASMLPAMLLGRIIWGVARVLLIGANVVPFTWALFITNGFVEAVPGIVVQLILVPIIMSILNKTKLLKTV